MLIKWASVAVNQSLELSIKSFKEGRNRGFDPSLKKLFIKVDYFIVFWSIF